MSWEWAYFGMGSVVVLCTFVLLGADLVDIAGEVGLEPGSAEARAATLLLTMVVAALWPLVLGRVIYRAVMEEAED